MVKRKLVEIMDNLPEDHLLKCIESFGCLKVQEKPQEKRKNVDYQWSEYIVYIVCKNKDYKTVQEIISDFDETVPKGYLKDLQQANPQKVMNYYNRFNDAFKKLELNVSEVYLLGKNQSKYPEIKKLHVNLVNIKLKADIIIKTITDTFIGFSVKSTPKDTLTNYSVYKMLDQEKVKLLKQIQENIIQKHGLSTDREVYRENREQYNRLFGNSRTIDNDYHKSLNNLILDNSEDILRQWYKNLFGDLPYRLYTFDGTTLTDESPSPLSIDIKPIENPAKNPEGAAKLFYILYNDRIPLYKWEIRWKGDVFVSPQILTFKWNPEKDNLRLI